MPLEPCTEPEFRAALVAHAVRRGWRLVSDRKTRRLRGYVAGELVLEFRVIGLSECYFRKPLSIVQTTRPPAGYEGMSSGDTGSRTWLS